MITLAKKTDEYQDWLNRMIKASERKDLYVAALAYQGALAQYEAFKKRGGDAREHDN